MGTFIRKESAKEAEYRRVSTETRQAWALEIRARRMKLGITGKDLADQCGCGTSAVSNAERGLSVRVDSIIRMAHGVGLELILVPRED